MRSAFGLLESLVALVVFSVVILVCSQTLLEIHQDMKILKASQKSRDDLAHAIFYLENQLRYAFISSISPQGVEYYEIHRDFFFSHFDPHLEKCDSNRIKKINDAQFVAFFSPSFQIARVLREDQSEMILDRKAECGAMIPIKKKKRILLASNKVLYVDSYPLLSEVNEFDLKQEGQEFEIKLCSDSCLIYQFFQGEIFYVF